MRALRLWNQYIYGERCREQFCFARCFGAFFVSIFWRLIAAGRTKFEGLLTTL